MARNSRKPHAAPTAPATDDHQPDLTGDQWRAIWKQLPIADKRFMVSLSVLVDLIGDDSLRYCEPPAAVGRELRKLDRDRLFGTLSECIGLLIKTPFVQRAKHHRRRGGDHEPLSIADAFLG